MISIPHVRAIRALNKTGGRGDAEQFKLQTHNSSFGKLQVGKGGLPPLKIQFHSTLSLSDVERGQATLPYLQFSEA